MYFSTATVVAVAALGGAAFAQYSGPVYTRDIAASAGNGLHARGLEHLGNGGLYDGRMLAKREDSPALVARELVAALADADPDALAHLVRRKPCKGFGCGRKNSGSGQDVQLDNMGGSRPGGGATTQQPGPHPPMGAGTPPNSGYTSFGIFDGGGVDHYGSDAPRSEAQSANSPQIWGSTPGH